jgi:RHS repeat-associated protein
LANEATAWTARSTIAVTRRIRRTAKNRGIDPNTIRLSYGKVAEMQRRGVVHFHAIIRLDGADPTDPDAILPPPAGLTAQDLVDAVEQAAATVGFTTDPHPAQPTGWHIAWGEQIDTRPIAVTADGKRLITREPSATTLYVLGQEIRLETGTSTPSWTRYYSHNGHVVAMRNSISGLTWLLSDHQDTNLASVTGGNLAVTTRRQTPFGALRGGAPTSWPDRHGFVGGTNDESGLTNVGARLYDSSSGRFLSADPVVDNNDPQQLNGYAYSNNSPVTFSDPTGPGTGSHRIRGGQVSVRRRSPTCSTR